MNPIPWTRFFIAVAGLLVISTVGCDPAKAQDEPLPRNPRVCWDHPTLNEDGSPLTDLQRFRIKFDPEDGQSTYWFFLESWGIQPDADENGRQCVEWTQLWSRLEFEAQRQEKPMFGEWLLILSAIDVNGNASGQPVGQDTPFPNPTVRIVYVDDIGDTQAPRPATNFTAETAEP